LQLDGPGSFDPPENNTVVGFGANDQIDIGGLLYGTSSTETFTQDQGGGAGILKVTNGDGVTANIHLAGDYTSGNFELASDGHGGTLVSHLPR
jgi:hypothetical protein